MHPFYLQGKQIIKICVQFFDLFLIASLFIKWRWKKFPTLKDVEMNKRFVWKRLKSIPEAQPRIKLNSLNSAPKQFAILFRIFTLVKGDFGIFFELGFITIKIIVLFMGITNIKLPPPPIHLYRFISRPIDLNPPCLS